MGNICHGQKIEVLKRLPPRDIQYEAFHEDNSEIFEVIEKINLFQFFRLEEISYLYFKSFSGDDLMVDGVSHDIFIEKKFLKNPNVCEYMLNNQKEMTKMKDFTSKMFDILFKAFKSYYKEVTDKKYNEKNKIPYQCFLAIGVLWGHARIDVKIDYIFNLLSNGTGTLPNNLITKYFFFALFALPSCVTLFAYKMLAEENEEYLKEIQKFDFETIFGGYEVKDCIHSAKSIIEYLFESKSSLTYEEYRNKIDTDRHCQSILTVKGIRNFINKHDV